MMHWSETIMALASSKLRRTIIDAVATAKPDRTISACQCTISLGPISGRNMRPMSASGKGAWCTTRSVSFKARINSIGYRGAIGMDDHMPKDPIAWTGTPNSE